MSTVKTTYLQHPSSGTANITLNADGTVANAAGMGKILQVVSTTKTDTFTTASSSFTTVTDLAATITPTSASNKVLVIANVTIGTFNSAGDSNFVRLVRGGTAIAVGDADGSKTQAGGGVDGGTARYSPISVSMTVLDSPATTSATTYSVEAAVDGNPIFINRSHTETDNAGYGRYASTITVMEVAA